MGSTTTVDAGTRVGGEANIGPHWWARFKQAFPNLPPYPSAGQLAPARMPEPSQLPIGTSDQGSAWTLAQSYQGAVFAKCPGYKLNAFRKLTVETITQSKHYPALVLAADAMKQSRVPPAAWVAFSFDTWRRYGPADMRAFPPAVAWVFSEKRLVDRLEWFGQSEGEYRGGRVYVSPSHSKLLRKWHEMHRRFYLAVVRAGALPRPDLVVDIVQDIFPGEAYRNLLDAAENENCKMQEQWNDAVARGEMIW